MAVPSGDGAFLWLFNVLPKFLNLCRGRSHWKGTILLCVSRFCLGFVILQFEGTHVPLTRMPNLASLFIPKNIRF